MIHSQEQTMQTDHGPLRPTTVRESALLAPVILPRQPEWNRRVMEWAR